MRDVDTWAELQKGTQDSEIVLVLGAGVSLGCGLPSWEELLCRLAERCFSAQGRATCQQLLRNWSYPAVANMIETEFKNSRPSTGIPFWELVREELYRDFPFYGKHISDDPGPFVDYVRRENPTLAAVAAFCTTNGATAGTFERNPVVRGVVNFNLDYLLQAYVRARYGRRLIVRTLERPSSTAKRERIGVYHIHGLLSHDRRDFNDLQKEAPDAMVITEQQYFDFFNSPTGMFTYTFLFLLRECRCIFIGMSLRDDNLRRVLHYSRTERLTSNLHEKHTEEGSENRSTRHFAFLRRSGDSEADRVAAQALKRLGTLALWIDGYDEIPHRLGELYNAVGHSWNLVYP